MSSRIAARLELYTKRFFKFFGLRVYRWHSLAMIKKHLDIFVYMKDMVDRVKTLDGSVVECGVGTGRTFFFFMYLTSIEKKNRPVWGFDSFEGFPEPLQEDKGTRPIKAGEWGDTSPEDIERFLRSSGIGEEDMQRARLVKGFVEDTLDEYDGAPIALLHIDLDLYSAYKVTLERLFPHVVQGGYVLFDEYNSNEWPGAGKAIDEFFAGKPWKIEQHPISKRYFLQKT